MKFSIPTINKIENLNSEKEIFINKNKDVFEGIGKFSDEIKIKLTKNAIPKLNPPRKEPIKIMNKFKDYLDMLMKLEIIEPSLGPNEWQSNLEIVEKPDTL